MSKEHVVFKKTTNIVNLNADVFQKSVVPDPVKGKQLTLLLSANGSLGCFFAKEPTFKSEMAGLQAFVDYVRFLEKNSGTGTVVQIILDSCFSANEYYKKSRNTLNYLNSPARLVSAMLPGIEVLGFIGTNNGVGVKGWRSMGDSMEKEAQFKYQEGTVVFRNGLAINHDRKHKTMDIWCDHDFSEEFIIGLVGINEQQLYNSSIAIANVNDLYSGKSSTKQFDDFDSSFGQRQLKVIGFGTLGHESRFESASVSEPGKQSDNRYGLLYNDGTGKERSGEDDLSGKVFDKK